MSARTPLKRMAPGEVSAGADFELARQERETRNEILIALLRGGLMLIFLIVELAVIPLLGLKIVVSQALIIWEGVWMTASAAVYLILRRNPPYHRVRKYAISLIDLAMITGIVAIVGLTQPSAPFSLSAVALALMVVLAAMRYSNRLVWLVGTLAAIIHLSVAFLLPKFAGNPIFAVSGALIVMATTGALAHINASLLRLHRDSVAQDRFRRFLAPEVIDEVLAAPEITLGAAEKEVTVLFSDISGFTRMSSGMSPKEVVGLLNEYFPPMAEIVFRYGGTLEKYIGDAVLAEWGAPITRPDDPLRALTAAVQMMHKVRELNRHWEANSQRAIQIHVGLHTGKVAAGNIGSDIYLQYATIGDTTNVASRICSAAEGGQVLISEETRQKLGESPYKLEKLPPVAVKGKEKPLKLYRVMWEGQAMPTEAA